MLCFLALAFSSTLPVLAQNEATKSGEEVRLRVLGDNVNLRAKPDIATGMVLGQADFHDELILIRYQDKWAQVRLPNVKAWVHSDFLHDGRIVKSKSLKVRSGPGTNHAVLTQLPRGAEVSLVSTNATSLPWVQIDGRDYGRAWIYRDYVEEIIPEPEPEPEVAAAPPEPERPQVIPPPGVKIDPSKPQGLRMKSEGMLQFHPQIGYYVANAQGGVLCTLRVPDAQVRNFNGKQVYVEGQSFWMPGVTAPLMVPSRISEIRVYQRPR